MSKELWAQQGEHGGPGGTRNCRESTRAGGGMSPSRKEMAGQEAGAPAWDGESDDFPVKSRGYPCCQQKAHAEEEGLV